MACHMARYDVMSSLGAPCQRMQGTCHARRTWGPHPMQHGSMPGGHGANGIHAAWLHAHLVVVHGGPSLEAAGGIGYVCSPVHSFFAVSQAPRCISLLLAVVSHKGFVPDGTRARSRGLALSLYRENNQVYCFKWLEALQTACIACSVTGNNSNPYA